MISCKQSLRITRRAVRIALLLNGGKYIELVDKNRSGRQPMMVMTFVGKLLVELCAYREQCEESALAAVNQEWIG